MTSSSIRRRILAAGDRERNPRPGRRRAHADRPLPRRPGRPLRRRARRRRGARRARPRPRPRARLRRPRQRPAGRGRPEPRAAARRWRAASRARCPASPSTTSASPALSAVGLAAGMLREGEATCVLVGGFDSMTGAPHAVHVRGAAALGDQPMIDVMVHDGLYCSIQDVGMGELSDAENARLDISREDQDAFAAQSHARAAAATDDGRLAEEIAPLDGARPRRGHPPRTPPPSGSAPSAAAFTQRRHDHRRQRVPALRRRRRRRRHHRGARQRRGPRAARRDRRPRGRRGPRLDAAPAPRRGRRSVCSTATG